LKQAIRHITIFLLTATVLVSSTGVSVHRLYCYCKGEVVASLFHPDDPCEMAAAPAENDGCCKTGKCEAPAEKKHHNCSDCNAEYVKLDVKYLVFTADFQITAPAALLPTWAVSETLVILETTKISWEQDLPPPAGKELLPWIQSFLC
jgi:hypothetical protein